MPSNTSKNTASKFSLEDWRAELAVGAGVLATAVLLPLAALAALWLLPGPHTTHRLVYVPRGDGFVQIVKQLDDAGVLHSERVFRRTILVLGLERSLRAGEYRVPRRASMGAVLWQLATQPPLMRSLVVSEGRTSQQIVAQVQANLFLRGDILAVPPEGSLLPETYFFERGSERNELLARMRQAMDEALAQTWAAHPPPARLRSKHELLVLASIIEKETGQASERGLVSAVFHNRLQKRMRLQSDPTVIYGLVGGKGTLGRPLRQSELDRRTPYNTYTRRGLPPGPIANPGRAALQAAMQPLASSAYYFVADGTGGHVFAETLAEHNKNVAKWRRYQRAQRNAKP